MGNNRNDDGTYPSYDRSWKKKQIQGETEAYEGKMPKWENEAREEAVPTEGMEGIKRHRR